MAGPTRQRLGWLEPALDLIRRRYFGRREGRREWSATEWLRATGAALAERLGPALGEAAAAKNVVLPRASWTVLAAARLENERRLKTQEQAMRELAAELEARGLAPVVFKGPALARHYPVSLVREAGDIDLLIAPDQLAGVAALLREAGYRHQAGGGRLASRYALTYTRAASDGEEVVLDLHPAWHEVTLTADGGGVVIGETREPVIRSEIGGARWGLLPAKVELYVAAAHAILHSYRTLSVYLDLAVLLTAVGESSVAGAGALARAMGRERHLRHGLTMATDLFGPDVGSEYLSLPGRLGVPVAVRLGYVGSRFRFLPSSLVMELVLRRGVQRKLDFARWVLGHGQQEGGTSPRRRARRLLQAFHGVRWLKGTLLRYRVPRSLPLRP